MGRGIHAVGVNHLSLMAAIANLPITGGNIIVPSNFSQLDGTTVIISKPVHIIFEPGIYTYSGTGLLFSITGGTEGVRISGSNRGGTSTTQGTVLSITNTAAIGINATNAPNLVVEDLTVLGPGSGTGKGLVVSGTRPYFRNVLVSSFGGDGITIDGSAINTNMGTFTHVRSQNNGGHGWKVLGADANVQTFQSCDGAGNTGDGWNVATGGNIFQGTNTDGNSSGIGYHFMSGSLGNRGILFSDAPNAPETTAIKFEIGANNHVLQKLSPNMPVVNLGIGNQVS